MSVRDRMRSLLEGTNPTAAIKAALKAAGYPVKKLVRDAGALSRGSISLDVDAADGDTDAESRSKEAEITGIVRKADPSIDGRVRVKFLRMSHAQYLRAKASIEPDKS